MAINVNWLAFPASVETGESKPIAISIENDTANDITISGISFVDDAGVYTGGAFIPCFKVAEDVYSAGTPQLNQVPAWGTPEQSSENISGNPLIYFPANLSGVNYVPAVEGINYASGSYGGQSVNIPAPSDPIISTSVVIPAGETCYYATQFTSLQKGSLYQPLPGQVEIYGDVKILVLVEGSTTPLSTTATDPYLYTGTATGLRLVAEGLDGSTNVLAGSQTSIVNLYQYSRNPQYGDFDFPVRAYLATTLGTEFDVTPYVSDFLSSDDAVFAIDQGASEYYVIPDNVVGGNPKIYAGGGAVTIVPDGAGTFDPAYATITATYEGFNASLELGLIKKLAVSFQVTQQLPLVVRYAAGQALYECFPVIIYEDGLVEDETGGGYVLMEFDAATNQGDGLTSGICRWDDQDYGYFYVNGSQSVDTNTFIKITWIDTNFPLLMGLPPIYVPVLVKAN